ncbi:phosphoadenosine phosphosulfate reductase family protein [Microbaculum sp. A6E488]|uniref:Phosphoadenosine phosphosulfate reductase family protein n=1 Tax=Microbaculum marinisediminis TaxID=2931392 RepID=A0AAW5QX27_9HYPH|nr:phosphoadenosine phosphosulfate reductase family protein [Microbaculum sp. A6E488]
MRKASLKLLKPMIDKFQRVHEICEILKSIDYPLTVGFSGGKDSSAVVKLLWACARILKTDCPPLKIVYCDTEVENPVIDSHVKKTLRMLQAEANDNGIRISCEVIKPEIHRGFFVRIIGRGYPPPTNSFRWCTKDIRIRPFQLYLGSKNEVPWIAIGTRYGESAQRDRSLKKHEDSSSPSRFIQRQREGNRETRLLTPIIDFGTTDVWDILCEFKEPHAIDVTTLATLYKDGSGECPAIRDFKDKPCSKARFGCWTCTVVRNDKSAENLINSGYDELRPFFTFRSWLAEYRNDPNNRCSSRRNGRKGPGPFTISARHEIYSKIRDLECITNKTIINNIQSEYILYLINIDLSDQKYLASDPSALIGNFPLFSEMNPP